MGKIKPVVSIWVPYRSIDRVTNMEVDNLTWYQANPTTDLDEGNDWVNVFIPFDYFIRLKDKESSLNNLSKDMQI